jgi:hypothetical protein
MYKISRDVLAQMIAAHTCRVKDAIAEQEDYDLADELIRRIETRYDGFDSPPQEGGSIKH